MTVVVAIYLFKANEKDLHQVVLLTEQRCVQQSIRDMNF